MILIPIISLSCATLAVILLLIVARREHTYLKNKKEKDERKIKARKSKVAYTV